jgi:DNA-binding NarL/FixJ family response regulator
VASFLHVSHIYDKIGVRSRAALALFGMKHGMLSVDRIDSQRP